MSNAQAATKAVSAKPGTSAMFACAAACFVLVHHALSFSLSVLLLLALVLVLRGVLIIPALARHAPQPERA